jgi:uncharacterized protein involved in outer membrane biogenesis
MRRLLNWKLWTAAAALAVALFAAGGYFGLPALARWGIETVGSRELGRALKVEQVRVNPFLLELTATGLTMADADPADPPWLSVDAVTIDLSASSLWQRAPVLDALTIDGLRARIVRSGPQRFNFSDIIERLQARPKPADSKPARFALYNIALARSSISIDDRVTRQQHALTDIALNLPFVSSIDSHREIKLQPSLALRADGTAIELKGETLPFHATRESTLRLNLKDVDLPRYLPYVPVRLNFDIPRGKLDTDLQIAFRQPEAAAEGQPARAATLAISGTAALNDFALALDGGKTPLLALKRLDLRIGSFEPLAGRLAVEDIVLDAPDVRAERGADGRIDWMRLLPAPQATAAAPAPAAPAPAASRKPFAWSVQRMTVKEGRVRYRDAPLGGFEQTLDGIAIEVKGLDGASATPAQLQVDARVQPQGKVGLSGQMTMAPLAGALDYRAEGVELRAFAALVARVSAATLTGSTSVAGRVEFKRADEGFQLSMRDLKAEGRELRLRGPAGSGAELDIARLSLDGGTLDLTKSTLALGALTLEAPRVRADRLADGRINWALLARGGNSAAGGKRPVEASRPASAAAATPFKVTLESLNLARGQLRFTDTGVEPALRVQLAQIQGSARNISIDGSRKADLALTLRTGSGGRLAVNGSARWDRLLADLRIDARNLDMAPVRGYANQYLNATLVSGELSSLGRLSLAAQAAPQPMKVRYEGSARLSNLHVIDAIDGNDNDLLKWQSLGVDRMDVAFGDGPPRIDLGTIALNEFYARLILSEKGRLNLLDLPRRAPAAPSATATSTEPTAAAVAPRPHIRVERIEIGAGNVNFTDNFIKPNYTANLTGLAGFVTTLASDLPEPATLDLNGKVDNDAPLSIKGRLNPLAPKLLLDLQGVTKGVDLPRLTPYATKYAGYPITKGKLSLDIRYQIADGQLKANNHLFLDQLTFGERVESASATKLPVMLAVALLTNSRGEIDINLPISGSLNDPKFSVGGIVVQVIVNLITKAITAPFTLLASAFGGGEELSHVAFPAGSTTLGAEQVTHLEKLARALNDRPALRLDIAGRADATADTAGLLDARYEARLRAAAVRQRVRAGETSVDPASVVVTPQERPALVAAVYAAEPIADKPRTLGIARNIPAADMEWLTRAHLAQTPVDLRALANARATAVRDWLLNEGKVARERLFVVEPRLERKNGEPADAGQRVDFSLK